MLLHFLIPEQKELFRITTLDRIPFFTKFNLTNLSTSTHTQIPGSNFFILRAIRDALNKGHRIFLKIIKKKAIRLLKLKEVFIYSFSFLYFF